MTAPLPPEVQRRAIYEQTVRALLGVDTTTAEAAVINPDDQKLKIEIRDLSRKLHLIIFGADVHFFSRRSGPATAHDIDQLLALSRIYAEVCLVMSEQDAARWMLKPNRQLGGQSPFALLQSRTGERRVRDYLANLLTGNFA